MTRPGRSAGEAEAGGYAAARDGATWLDRSDRTRAVFHGSRAIEVLNGLLTNDLSALAPGSGAFAAALTPKGKVIADVRVFVRASDVLVDAPAAAAAGWWQMVRKYVNPRLARSEDVSATIGDVSLFGAGAAGMLGAAAAIDAGALAPYAHRPAVIGGVPVTVARVPDAGIPGFAIFLPRGSQPAVVGALEAAGAVPLSPAAFEVLRVEAGRPAWGVDMDDGTLAQEARFEELDGISYTKGCYTGQETVARVHFRGHVNRALAGVRFASTVDVPRGTPLVRADGTVAGEVRSAVVSPRLGAIGLAMVRRDVGPGSELALVVAGGDRVRATVTALPFAG